MVLLPIAPSPQSLAPGPFGDGVDGFAQQHVGGFHPGFGEGGMGVDGVGEFGGGQLGANGGGGFRDEVRGVEADHLRAQQLLGLGIRDPLHEAARVADGQRLSQRAKIEFAGLDFLPLLLRFLLGQPDRPDFG